jgi:two-component system, NtrC family, sensor histidine kinase HydH
METAQQPDIVHLIVTDLQGNIVAHSDSSQLGGLWAAELDLTAIYRSGDLQYRLIADPDNGSEAFEVYRRFSPSIIPRSCRDRMMRGRHHFPDHPPPPGLPAESNQIIFVGMDMAALDGILKEDTRQTVILAAVLLIIGIGGMVTLFYAQAYRSARTSLTRVQAFSDHVVENMPIGLVAMDADNKIVSFNQAAESIFRTLSRDSLGKNARDVLPPVVWNLTQGLKGEKGVLETEMDCSLIGENRSVPLDVSVSVLKGEADQFLGYLILFRDLSEVRELKGEVEKNRRLAALGQLAAGVAHEIRNPLSSIKGFATYFRERFADSPDDQSTASIMIQEVDRLNRVITQLLDYTRPVKLQKRPTPIHGVIHHSLKMVEQQALDKQIRIETDLAPDIRELTLDPDPVKQVLMNLYLNAVEAMTDGGLLRVTLGWHEQGKWVRLTVADTGTGIESKDLAHIFDPYFTRKPSGTGLGLAIAQKIIESHGGRMTIESRVGKGTQVMILLPYDGSADAAAQT